MTGSSAALRPQDRVRTVKRWAISEAWRNQICCRADRRAGDRHVFYALVDRGCRNAAVAQKIADDVVHAAVGDGANYYVTIDPGRCS